MHPARGRIGRSSAVVALLAISAFFAGCQDSGVETRDNGQGSLRVLVTDAASELFASAMVTIDEVTLIPEKGDVVPLELAGDGSEKVFDLLTLRNGVEAELADAYIATGSYSQLRLHVSSAHVTLASGLTFADGTNGRPLAIPSGEESGIKVALDGPVVVAEGGITTLVLDIDVEKNFVVQGNPGTPAGIQDVLFTPSVHEKRRGIALSRPY